MFIIGVYPPEGEPSAVMGKEIADAIIRMAEMPSDKRVEMGQRARIIALNKYSMDVAKENLNNLLADIEDHIKSKRSRH